MQKVFVFICMGILLVACEKQYKQKSNSDVKTVEALNKGDYDAVIDSLKAKSSLTSRQRYYLASAYSRKGGIDVFSLYSVLEIQIFHKNALEWSDLSKEKNPYLKFMKSQEGVDYEERLKKRKALWERYEGKLIAKNDYIPVLSVAEIRKFFGTIDGVPSQEKYDETHLAQDDAISKPEFEKLTESPLSLNEKTDQLFDLAGKIMDERYKVYNQGMEEARTRGQEATLAYQAQHHYAMHAIHYVAEFYTQSLELHERKMRYLYPEMNQELPVSSSQWEVLYMNVLWNTYEAIPVMRKMPSLTADQQSSVSEALEHYLALISDKAYRDVALKNIVVLTGISILSIYKDSLDLENVENVTDLYCSFEPQKIIDNYGVIRSRLDFILRGIERSGIEMKRYQTYKNRIEAFKRDIPVEPSEVQKQSFLQSVDDFKVDTCFKI